MGGAVTAVLAHEMSLVGNIAVKSAQRGRNQSSYSSITLFYPRENADLHIVCPLFSDFLLLSFFTQQYSQLVKYLSQIVSHCVKETAEGAVAGGETASTTTTYLMRSVTHSCSYFLKRCIRPQLSVLSLMHAWELRDHSATFSFLVGRSIREYKNCRSVVREAGGTNDKCKNGQTAAKSAA